MSRKRVRRFRMGVFQVRVRFYSLRDPTKEREIEVTVDTGATLSILPRKIAEELDVLPEGRRWFYLADGSRVSREVGSAGVEYEERRLPTTVVLGAPHDPPLLGAVALESLGYEADPVHRTLRPATRLPMLAARLDSAAPRTS